MNESDTRYKKIDPALKAAGWGVIGAAISLQNSVPILLLQVVSLQKLNGIQIK